MTRAKLARRGREARLVPSGSMAAARLALKLLFSVSVAAVTVLSLVPPSAELPISFLSDKLQHASAYAWLAFVGCAAVQARTARIAIIVALPGLGAAIELLQFLVPDRMPEVADELANLAGVLVGAGLYWLLERYWIARRGPAV